MSVQRFRRQRAVNIAVSGSYSLDRWYSAKGKLRTFACRTERVSPFRMIVEGPVVGRVGDRLTSYFSEFGELVGSISDTTHGGFLFEMEMTGARRVQLAEKLTWLESKLKDPSIKDVRGEVRIIPRTSQSMLTLADGSIHGCFIIDMSRSGAAVSAELQPPVGMPLAVGACIGRVVRIFRTGFAVKFVERYDLDDLNRLIVLRPEEPAGSVAAGSTPPATDARRGLTV